MRFLVALALIGSVIAASILADDTSGGGSAPSPDTNPAAIMGTTAAAHPVRPCRATELRLSLAGGAGASLSQLRTGVQLRNAGRAKCTLDGYPRIAWVAAAAGGQVGPTASRLAGAAHPRRIMLRPGRIASAPLDIVEGDGGLPASECRPEAVAGLRVALPGGRGSRLVRASPGDPAGACSVHTPVPLLGVGALAPGRQPGNGGTGG